MSVPRCTPLPTGGCRKRLELRAGAREVTKFLGRGTAWEGRSERVRTPSGLHLAASRGAFHESGCLGMQPKMGGKSLLRLNTGERPIANKYREGKMQRTLKRELKVLEIVGEEAIGN